MPLHTCLCRLGHSAIIPVSSSPGDLLMWTSTKKKAAHTLTAEKGEMIGPSREHVHKPVLSKESHPNWFWGRLFSVEANM